MADEPSKDPDKHEGQEDLKNPANNQANGQAAGQSPPKEKQKIKPMSPLEEIVHGASSALQAGLAIAAPLAMGHFVPSAARDAAILSGAQVLGDLTTDWKRGKRYTMGNALESSLAGTILSPALAGAFNAVHQIPLDSVAGYIGQAAVWGGLVYPLYFGLYQTVNYVIRNKSFSGLGKYLKENFGPALKKAYKTIFPISLINLLLVPAWLNIPVAAALTYGVSLFGAPKKDEVKEHQKRDKTPYLVAASSAAGKLAKNVVYGVSQAAYGIGRGILDKMNKYLGGSAGPSATPAPAPAGAGSHQS